MSLNPIIEKAVGRSVKEWRGATPDARIPPRVKLRIWNRENGMCHLTKRKIRPGELYDFDHGIALINGGPHCESNLFPALRDKHKEKTKDDLAEKAKVAAIAKNHIGAKADKPKIVSRGFAKADKPDKVEKLPMPPPRAIFK